MQPQQSTALAHPYTPCSALTASAVPSGDPSSTTTTSPRSPKDEKVSMSRNIKTEMFSRSLNVGSTTEITSSPLRLTAGPDETPGLRSLRGWLPGAQASRAAPRSLHGVGATSGPPADARVQRQHGGQGEDEDEDEETPQPRTLAPGSVVEELGMRTVQGRAIARPGSTAPMMRCDAPARCETARERDD